MLCYVSTMSFNELAQKAVGEGTIGVGFLIDRTGNQFWTVGEWPGFNPQMIVDAWQKGENAVQVGDLRFSVINKGEDRFVATNLAGQGHIILAKCMFWDGYLITWCPATVDNRVAFAEIVKMANSVRA